MFPSFMWEANTRGKHVEPSWRAEAWVNTYREISNNDFRVICQREREEDFKTHDKNH
jgi:hypothetical protein